MRRGARISVAFRGCTFPSLVFCCRHVAVMHISTSSCMKYGCLRGGAHTSEAFRGCTFPPQAPVRLGSFPAPHHVCLGSFPALLHIASNLRSRLHLTNMFLQAQGFVAGFPTALLIIAVVPLRSFSTSLSMPGGPEEQQCTDSWRPATSTVAPLTLTSSILRKQPRQNEEKTVRKGKKQPGKKHNTQKPKQTTNKN